MKSAERTLSDALEALIAQTRGAPDYNPKAKPPAHVQDERRARAAAKRTRKQGVRVRQVVATAVGRQRSRRRCTHRLVTFCDYVHGRRHLETRWVPR